MSASISFGVVLIEPYQLLDGAGALDILSMATRDYLSANGDAFPHLQPKAPHITFHYISHSLEPVTASVGPQQLPTCTYTTCPKLDYLLVPGPPLSYIVTDELRSFIIEKSAEAKGVMGVCTGAWVLSQAGVLDGKKAVLTKGALLALHQAGILRKEVLWQKIGRFENDGKFWTASGPSAGMDMMAEFMRRNFDRELVEALFEMAEFTPLGKDEDRFGYILVGLEL
ncbi:hypothetical protein RUND412_007032 [Rhizina undulata]